MSLPKSGKSPITDTVDKSASAVTDETKITSVDDSVTKDNEASPTVCKPRENVAETQQAETTDKPEFKTPETDRKSQLSTRNSATRKKKTDRKSLDDARKQLVF